MFSFVSNQMNLRVNYAQSNKISFEGHGPRAFETFAGELIQPRQHGVWQRSGFVQTEEPDTVGQGCLVVNLAVIRGKIGGDDRPAVGGEQVGVGFQVERDGGARPGNDGIGVGNGDGEHGVGGQYFADLRGPDTHIEAGGGIHAGRIHLDDPETIRVSWINGDRAVIAPAAVRHGFVQKLG